MQRPDETHSSALSAMLLGSSTHTKGGESIDTPPTLTPPIADGQEPSSSTGPEHLYNKAPALLEPYIGPSKRSLDRERNRRSVLGLCNDSDDDDDGGGKSSRLSKDYSEEDGPSLSDMGFMFEEGMGEDGSDGPPPLSASISKGRLPFEEFLCSYSCYDTVPLSGKVVTLDVRLSVKVAFLALCDNNIKAAPLWCSHTRSFVGMLDVTDVLAIIRYHYNHKDSEGDEERLLYEELEQSILRWKEIIQAPTRGLSTCRPDETLSRASEMMHQLNYRRIPLVDPMEGKMIGVITLSRILRFMLHNLPDEESSDVLFQCPIRRVGVGTYKGIIVAQEDDSFISMLNLIAKHRLSACPIVDREGRLLGKFAKSDIKKIASQRMFKNMDRSVGEVVLGVIGSRETYCFSPADTFREVLEKFATTKVYSMVAVDGFNRVRGVCTLSDVFRFFLELG